MDEGESLWCEETANFQPNCFYVFSEVYHGSYSKKTSLINVAYIYESVSSDCIIFNQSCIRYKLSVKGDIGRTDVMLNSLFLGFSIVFYRNNFWCSFCAFSNLAIKFVRSHKIHELCLQI